MDQLRGKSLDGGLRVELRGSALPAFYRCTTVTRIAMHLPLETFICGCDGVIVGFYWILYILLTTNNYQPNSGFGFFCIKIQKCSLLYGKAAIL
jgi:hypothetical protein